MMHDKDYYSKLGFKCGLEIHQRLATAEKLFCKCSTNAQGDLVIARVERRQRAVAGEMGRIDRSTSFESSRGRKFVYSVFNMSSCLVDIDEEPPHEVNREAVETALMFASAFGASVPDEIEPMRKEVVDGSDPSAFQRSMMVAYGGEISAGNSRIPITSIFLEEESSGIERTEGNTVFYSIDRIGVPLIEIDTAPSISTPEEAKAVALAIGSALRLTGKKGEHGISGGAMRGIGTIRQDVNVSISGGTRVEIKGLQEVELMDLFIENEVERQRRLIEIQKKLKSRGAEVSHMPKDVTSLLSKASGKVISGALSSGGIALAALLGGFSGLLGEEINPGRRLGSEISDYAKMAGVNGIIHSDEDLSKYGIGESLRLEINNAIGALSSDAFIIIVAEKAACSAAIEFALSRARMSLSEVPPETRSVADTKLGTTRFMRPLPGGSRMYPETDSTPIGVSREYYESIKKQTVYPSERIERLNSDINNRQIAGQMAMSPKLQLYEYITSKVKGVNLVVATTLLEKMKELERSGAATETDRGVLVEIFNKYASGKITKAAIGEILRLSPKSPDAVDLIIKEHSLAKMTKEQLIREVKSIESSGGKDIIKEIMSKHRLNVDGDELSAIIGVGK